MNSKWKDYVKNTFYTLGFIGMSDLILQGITGGEFKLIRTALASIFGA